MQAAFPLVTILLSISQKTFFLANWHYFLTMCLTNLKVGLCVHVFFFFSFFVIVVVLVLCEDILFSSYTETLVNFLRSVVSSSLSLQPQLPRWSLYRLRLWLWLWTARNEACGSSAVKWSARTCVSSLCQLDCLLFIALILFHDLMCSFVAAASRYSHATCFPGFHLPFVVVSLQSITSPAGLL